MTNEQHAQELEGLAKTLTSDADHVEAGVAMELVAVTPERLAALRAGAAALRAPQGECQWTESGDGPWEGACGAVWDFHVGGPEHNKMQFCPTCGKRLVVPPVSPVSEKE